jgi:predicted transcriptional regulator
MKVLLSIKPEYADRILSGEKRFEYRKSVFKDSTITTIVIYATKPVGMVVGEFVIDSVISGNPPKVWHLTSEFSGVSRDFYNDYFCGKNTAYAIKVAKAKRYKKPVELETLLPSGLPPQSFCYI